MKRPKFRVWSPSLEMFSIEKMATQIAISLDGVITVGYIDGDMMVPDDQERWIVEQYTGMKDKNGREIYEGDIVERVSGNTHVIEDVRNIPYDIANHSCEIVGNIHTTHLD